MKVKVESIIEDETGLHYNLVANLPEGPLRGVLDYAVEPDLSKLKADVTAWAKSLKPPRPPLEIDTEGE